jgi:hypothetical protein
MAKCGSLKQYFQDQTSAVVVLSLLDIERILGSRLPMSAHEYREWRANEKLAGRHVQSQAWQAGGYRVESVDLGRSHVTFKYN